MNSYNTPNGPKMVRDYKVRCNFCFRSMSRHKYWMAKHARECAAIPAELKYVVFLFLLLSSVAFKPQKFIQFAILFKYFAYRYTMDDHGGRIDEIANLTDPEISVGIDNMLCEWTIEHNIPAAAITDPKFKLMLQRVNRMGVEYNVPNGEQLNGRLLNLKYEQCVRTRDEVSLFVFFFFCVFVRLAFAKTRRVNVV